MSALLNVPHLQCPLCWDSIMGALVDGKPEFTHLGGGAVYPNTCPNAGKKYRVEIPTIEAEEIYEEPA